MITYLRQNFVSFKESIQTDEDKLVIFAISISIILHLFVLFFEKFGKFSPSEPLIPEWKMDTELVTEEDLVGPDKSTLPNAKQSEKEAVPSNLLPQLPQSFTVKQAQKNDDEGLPENKPEPQKEAEKEADKPSNDKDKPSPVSSTKQDEANKLAMQDAIRRLAIEKLRQMQNEKANRFEAPEQSSIVRLKDELKGSKRLQEAVAMGIQKEREAYGKILNRTISKHYMLPQTFQSTVAKPVVILAIVVNMKGELVSVKVHQSSNDPVFDEYTIAAAKGAAPYEKPPKSLVGKVIHLAFTR
ncbi:MAG: cell envelope integrity protein TolA [Oligoflexales bacterium]|nr:cell envelope integrity protein TolA [Oligoflexales bacterium]